MTGVSVFFTEGKNTVVTLLSELLTLKVVEEVSSLFLAQKFVITPLNVLEFVLDRGW